MPEPFDPSRPLVLQSGDYGHEIAKMDADLFVTVDDFAVELAPAGSLGFHLRLVSRSRGPLADFPWWDHAEWKVGQMAPLDLVGSAEEPYCDTDQGWTIVIWRDSEFVYVLEGDEVCATEFTWWFRVPVQVWIERWQEIIDAARGHTPA